MKPSLVSRLVALALAALCCSCAAPAAPIALVPSPAPSPTAAVTPTTAVSSPAAGTDEKWIEVDLAAQRVRLRRGNAVVAEYAAASGVAVSPETATLPGVYRVQQMIKDPIENVPGVFLSDILIYDLRAEVGIHSMPMDKDGNVLDATLGKAVTAGCVRVGEAAAVFEFAQLGTTVWVH